MTSVNPFQRSPYPTQGPPAAVLQGPKSYVWLWALGISLVVMGVGSIVCCGAAVMVFKFGMDVVERDIARQLENSPEIVEHIGTIETLSIDIMASGEVEGDDTLVYKVRGERGSGTLIVTSIGDDQEIVNAKLQLSDGREFILK